MKGYLYPQLHIKNYMYMKQGTQSQCSLTTERGRVGREEGGGFRVEGTHVYLQPIYIDVWQQLSQYCSYPTIKINTFKK